MDKRMMSSKQFSMVWVSALKSGLYPTKHVQISAGTNSVSASCGYFLQATTGAPAKYRNYTSSVVKKRQAYNT